MILANENKSVLLIDVTVTASELVAGLFYAEPTQDTTAIVGNGSKEPHTLEGDHPQVLVYKVFLPKDVQKSAVPMTGDNVRLRYEKV